MTPGGESKPIRDKTIRIGRISYPIWIEAYDHHSKRIRQRQLERSKDI